MAKLNEQISKIGGVITGSKLGDLALKFMQLKSFRQNFIHYSYCLFYQQPLQEQPACL